MKNCVNTLRLHLSARSPFRLTGLYLDRNSLSGTLPTELNLINPTGCYSKARRRHTRVVFHDALGRARRIGGVQ